ncbi:hypothetical protein SEA_COLUCCI_76 [Arthrobacter phage Colucci]|uniref:Uncharacterized protein n=1 Tax=Arthrobacter phage Colucci TaxID=2015834 RepID=A0A286N2Y8_9CAUD|nr:hypothetical protein FDI27_gp076 [Arthrobacter phage Colucci]ASX98745.1 hypothetical protein SEA_COLUCCI_76 [Arthrobacter phage Colucci]
MPRIELIRDHRGHIAGHVATVTKEEQEAADKRAAELKAYYADAADYDDWIDW